MNIFGCMKILWIFFVGHHKTGLVSGVISMHFKGLHFRSMYRMGIFLGVAKISNIFGGMPEIPDIFFVNSRCCVQACV